MAFMDTWKSWSQKQYDKWGSKLGPNYRKIEKWKTPKWAKELFDKIWDDLDEQLQKKLYKIIYEMCKEFDEDFAKTLLKQIVEAIKVYFKQLKP